VLLREPTGHDSQKAEAGASTHRSLVWASPSGAWGASPRSAKSARSARSAKSAKSGARTPGCKSAGHSMHDLFCPDRMPREFFVNVMLHGEDRSQHAAAIAKEQGRSKLGRIGSLLGGVMGTVMAGNAAFDSAIAQGVKDAVIESAVDALKRQRWWASVTPVFLPPLPGRSDWQPFVALGEKGHFMVFRVVITGRLPEESRQEKGIVLSLLTACIASCWAAETPPEDMEKKLVQEIALIRPEIESALQNRKYPINANVTIVDAIEEFGLLHEMNWSRELAADTIEAAREELDGPPAAVA